MKKKLTKILLPVAGAVIVFLGVYVLLGLYYRQSFAVNTWVNDIYCTGSTIEEINGQLVGQSVLPDLTVVDCDGQEYQIKGETIDLTPDYSSALRKIMKQRANYDWTGSLAASYQVTIEPESYRWNNDKLIEAFHRLAFVSAEKDIPTDTKVLYSEEDGYTFYDGKQNRLNFETAIAVIQNSIGEKQWKIDLADYGCYEDISDSEEDQRQRELWVRLQEYTDCGIVYDMGAEQLTFSPADMASFLEKDADNMPVVDETGSFVVRKDFVDAWVDRLGELYNTAEKERDFLATRGEIVKVTYNTYGTLLDLDAEKEYLYPAIVGKVSEVHTPVYLKEAYFRGQNDIGPTYVEVDMGEQRMYVYQDGELVIETDIVTGNAKRKWNTPEGVNYIYKKQKNRILRGPNYATPVKYWLPVVGNIGIHDAKWRKEFGGDIYLTNGSHGCINTPTEAVAQLYELAEVGMPVVMFY